MSSPIATRIGTASREEGGFTLIEVMFAAVYLSVGLLAIAAMQNIAIAEGANAKRLGYASNVAEDMIERIRSNWPANATGATLPYQNLAACNFVCTVPQVVAACSTCPGVPSAGNATGNPTALGDYNQWSGRLAALDASGQRMLPNAIGTVTSTLFPAPGGNALGQVLVTVQVQYGAGGLFPTHGVTLQTIVAP